MFLESVQSATNQDFPKSPAAKKTKSIIDADERNEGLLRFEYFYLGTDKPNQNMI